MQEKAKPYKTEKYDKLYQGKSIYTKFSPKTLRNTFIMADEGTFYFKEIEIRDMFKANVIKDVSVLYFKTWPEYNQFRNENPQLEKIAGSEQHADLRLIVQNRHDLQ